jgi:hypothetical protein
MSPCLSEEDCAHIITQHKAKIREFMQKTGSKLLQDCLAARFQVVFGSPVDVAQFPQYPSVVKHPMDFGTMRTKVIEDQYADLQDFLTDAQLVLDNARLFNPPGSDVHVMANCLQVCTNIARASLSVHSESNGPNSCLQDDLMKMLKDSVIRAREAVDCSTLKEIEQRRCELVGKSLIQTRNSIEEALEFAKSHLPVLARDAGQVHTHLSSNLIPNIVIEYLHITHTCGKRACATQFLYMCRQGIMPIRSVVQGRWMMSMMKKYLLMCTLCRRLRSAL